MKITVFNGSPRGENSNTHIMVKEFLAGAQEAGAEVENIFLVHKKIHHCLGCFVCWIKTPGICGIKDDVQELLNKYIESDIVVYASPLYVGGMTGIMKNFIDRSIPLAKPQILKSDEGVSYHPNRYEKQPKIVLLSNCGFPEQCHFKYFRNVFDYMNDNINSNIIAEIYRSQGELLKHDDFLLMPFLNGYKKVLRTAGREIVENQALSEKTKLDLEKPIVPIEMYRAQANKHFEQLLAENAV